MNKETRKKNPVTGLTPKQEQLCKNIVSGMNTYESYLNAYNHNGSINTAYTESCRLLARDDIKKYIETLKKPQETVIQASILSESERIKSELWSMINNPDTKDENRLRAMDILNRMNKAYTDNNADQKQETELSNIDSNQLMELIKVS